MPRPFSSMQVVRHVALVVAVLAAAALVVYALTVEPAEIDTGLLGPAPPSVSHPFGAEWIGRDQLSMVLHGLGLSAALALPVTAIWIALGLLAGTVAGRGWAPSSRSLKAVAFSALTAAALAATSVPLKMRLSQDWLVAVNEAQVWWLAVPWRYGMSMTWLLAITLTGILSLVMLAYAMYLAYRATSANARKPRLRSIAVATLVAVSAALLMELYVSVLGFGFAEPKQSLGQLLSGCGRAACWSQFWWIGFSALLVAVAATIIPLVVAMRLSRRHVGPDELARNDS